MIQRLSDGNLTAAQLARRRAKQFGLTYVESDSPGYTRRKAGGGYSYLHANGKPVRSKSTRQRIEELAIPPAWTDVWISRSAKAHLQATGRDDAGRKQYIYHEDWQEKSNGFKFDGLLEFGKLLPALRRTIHRDARRRAAKHARRKLLAGMVQLLDRAAIRIGNEEYVVANGSYGLATLLSEHATVRGSTITLEFTGKGGFEQAIQLRDRSLARFIRECKKAGHERLFVLAAVGEPQTVAADDLNEYLGEISGGGVTAKDFRTWRASVVAAEYLAACDTDLSASQRKKEALAAIDTAAEALGNTRAVCRKYYVHPQLIAAYEEGRLPRLLDGFRARRRKRFTAEEQRLLHLLKKLSRSGK